MEPELQITGPTLVAVAVGMLPGRLVVFQKPGPQTLLTTVDALVGPGMCIHVHGLHRNQLVYDETWKFFHGLKSSRRSTIGENAPEPWLTRCAGPSFHHAKPGTKKRRAGPCKEPDHAVPAATDDDNDKAQHLRIRTMLDLEPWHQTMPLQQPMMLMKKYRVLEPEPCWTLNLGTRPYICSNW